MSTTPSNGQYNVRSAGVRRLMQEAKELAEPTQMYHAQPTEDNLFEWHFTVRGPLDSDFEGGIYHGRMLFPPEYPMNPPNIILLTPNGRFELNKKICLSISGYHPETWLPSWSIRTALLALIGFMPTSGGGAIGSLSYPPAERKKLAKSSGRWECKECGVLMKDVLTPLHVDAKEIQQEARDLMAASSSTAADAAAGDASAPAVPSDDAGTVGPTPQEMPTPPSVAPPPTPRVKRQRATSSASVDWSYVGMVSLLIIFVSIFFMLVFRRMYMRSS